MVCLFQVHTVIFTSPEDGASGIFSDTNTNIHNGNH